MVSGRSDEERRPSPPPVTQRQGLQLEVSGHRSGTGCAARRNRHRRRSHCWLNRAAIFQCSPESWLRHGPTFPDLIRSVKAQALEGLVAKRRDSRYEPGERTGAWQKMRVNRGQEFVIAGYTVAGKTFDAIVFGYNEDGKLLPPRTCAMRRPATHCEPPACSAITRSENQGWLES